jgi:epsilon-lactone hydrolase
VTSLRGFVLRSTVVSHQMRRVFDPERTSVERMRAETERMGERVRIPSGSVVEPTNIGGVPAEWVISASVPADARHVIVYLHAGGFCLGYGATGRALAARLSAVAGARVLAVDYRLAPEHPYPCANDDCLGVYRGLLSTGLDPSCVAIGGDSAGAGLAFMTLLDLRDAGDPLPAAAFLMSPFGLDLVRFDGRSYADCAKSDPMQSRDMVMQYARWFFGDVERPLACLDRDLSGLPDLLLQVGDRDVLLSDSLRLEARAKRSGVDVRLEVWKGMWHDFQGFAGMVPEASQALNSVSEFLRERLH